MEPENCIKSILPVNTVKIKPQLLALIIVHFPVPLTPFLKSLFLKMGIMIL